MDGLDDPQVSVEDVVAGVDPASHPVRWIPSAENVSASELVSGSLPTRWPTFTGENDSAYELVSGSSPARQPTSSNEQAPVPEDDRGVENKRDLEYGFEGVCVCGRSQVHQDGGDSGRSA